MSAAGDSKAMAATVARDGGGSSSSECDKKKGDERADLERPHYLICMRSKKASGGGCIEGRG